MCCKSWQCRDYDDDDDFDDDDDVKEEEERMRLPSWQSPDDKTRILLLVPTKSRHFLVSSSELPFFGFQLRVAIFWFQARSCHFLDSRSELYIKIAIR